MMYLHIGNGVTVKKKDIIGIFDMDSATVSSITKKFMVKREKEGNLYYDDGDLPRAFLLTEEKDGCKMRLSRISTQGLKNRIEEDINE